MLYYTFLACVSIALLGALLFCVEVLAMFLRRHQPPRPAMRDWRDNARGVRR